MRNRLLANPASADPASIRGKRQIAFLATDHEIAYRRDISWTLRAKEESDPIREAGISTLLTLPQIRITDGIPIATAEDRLRVAVVLELQPVVIRINQEKSVVFQHITGVAKLRLHPKGQACLMGPVAKPGPILQAGPNQTEMAGVNAPLGRFAGGRSKLRHELVAAQVENEGLGTATAHLATQTIPVPTLRDRQIRGGYGEVKTGQRHDCDRGGADSKPTN